VARRLALRPHRELDLLMDPRSTFGAPPLGARPAPAARDAPDARRGDSGLAGVIGEVRGLTAHWDYVASEPGLWVRMRRIARRWRRSRPPPARLALKPLAPRDAWLVCFVFSPQGVLSTSHVYTLQRLRDMGLGVFVVCAAPDAQQVPAQLFGLSDALYWKALSGYDFSAYELALSAIARESPHATVFIMNDSVFGPFVDLRPFMQRSPWQLTGFTASSLHENHVQSYAFVMRDVDAQRVCQLRPALPEDYAYDRSGDVVLCQELYFTRVAARHMTVGACWHSVFERIPDATLVKPLELLDAGFPFMKKSVLGKHAVFQAHAQQALRERLSSFGHPL
jgi:hypothetical protein